MRLSHITVVLDTDDFIFIRSRAQATTQPGHVTYRLSSLPVNTIFFLRINFAPAWSVVT